MTTIETPADIQTLSHRLTEGRVASLEAVRYALLLANALRQKHEAGEVHGAITPAVVGINQTGLELLEAREDSDSRPYTAPEVLAGGTADACGDIYSFGIVLHEMLTGRNTPSDHVLAGSPEADRLIARCVALDPSARFQSMQKLVLELKMLEIALRRAEVPVREEPVDPLPALRSEIREIEAHLLEEIRNCKGSISAANERLQEVEQGVTTSAARLGAVEESLIERVLQLEQAATDAIGRVEANVHGRLETLEETAASITNERVLKVEQSTVIYGDRVEHAERLLDSLLRDTATLRDTVSEDLSNLSGALKTQSASIETARKGLARTDDVVERIVEALETLQCAVLQQSEKR